LSANASKQANTNADTATAGTAATPDAGMIANGVSKPGEYSGYSEAKYDSHELSSQYVPVRDGTQLAVDPYRPKDASGQVVGVALPVLWMHTPYNRRDFMGGLPGETYPGAAARAQLACGRAPRTTRAGALKCEPNARNTGDVMCARVRETWADDQTRYSAPRWTTIQTPLTWADATRRRCNRKGSRDQRPATSQGRWRDRIEKGRPAA
jgi:hypothetical protein